MIIKFASDLIKITFEENEPFSNRSLIMYGEVLHKGFAATLSTMSWILPDNEEIVTSSDKAVVCKLICNYNKNSEFRIDLIEE